MCFNSNHSKKNRVEFFCSKSFFAHSALCVKSFIAFLTILCIFLLSSCGAKGTLPSFVKDNMTLVWSDEFDGTSDEPNPQNWDYNTGGHGWGNSERQNYTKSRTNSFVSDGTLKIVAQKEKSKWTSARLITKGKQTWTYGYIEFRAKVPDQYGTWPALWMLPQTTIDYGQWPRSGEIDVMEYAKSTWDTKTFGTVHCKAGYGGNPINSVGVEMKGVDKKWHTYAVNWTADGITWYFDGKMITEYKNPHNKENAWETWPFDKPFYIIMNLAMGGNLGGDIPTDLERCQMEVDYVRVYQ